jgi:hypothetical protein
MTAIENITKPGHEKAGAEGEDAGVLLIGRRRDFQEERCDEPDTD